MATVHALPLSIENWAALVPLRCPLNFFFRLHCPTCGLGRALIAAALGQADRSFHYHPLGLPIFWGGQSLLLTWLLWPTGWTELVNRWQSFWSQHQRLLWLVILVYGIWGFCLRPPV